MPQPLELVMKVLPSRDRLPAWRGWGSPGIREPPRDKASPRDMPRENDHVQWTQPENAVAQNADPLHTRTPQASQIQCLSYTILTFASYIHPSSSVDLPHHSTTSTVGATLPAPSTQGAGEVPWQSWLRAAPPVFSLKVPGRTSPG